MCLNKTSSERAAEEEMQSLSAALTELAFLVLYAYPGVRSLTGPYPPGYVPAGLSAPPALSGLVFVIAPWAYSVPRPMAFSLVPSGLENRFAYSVPAISKAPSGRQEPRGGVSTPGITYTPHEKSPAGTQEK